MFSWHQRVNSVDIIYKIQTFFGAGCWFLHPAKWCSLTADSIIKYYCIIISLLLLEHHIIISHHSIFIQIQTRRALGRTFWKWASSMRIWTCSPTLNGLLLRWVICTMEKPIYTPLLNNGTLSKVQTPFTSSHKQSKTCNGQIHNG